MRKTSIALLALVAIAAGAWLILEDPTPNPTPRLSTDGERSTPDSVEGPGLKGSGAAAPPSQSAGRERFVIRGIVEDEEGEPLSGIRVELRRTVVRWPGSGYASTLAFNVVRIRARARALLAGLDKHLETIGELVSDERGRFEFRVAEGGSHHVYARPEPPATGGYGSAYLIKKLKESVEVTLKVLPGAALEGRVEDADGSPLSALVRARRRGWRGEIAAGASGRFRLPAVPLGELKLSLTLPSGRQITGFSAVVPTKEPLLLRVPAGSGKVSGTVSSAAGAVVPGALVTLHLEVPTGDDPKRWTRIELAAETDAEGHYGFSGLPQGKFRRLNAVATGFLAESRYGGREGWAAVPLADGENATIDITLRRGSTIHGQVTRKDDGMPIEGATVTLYYLGWVPPQHEVCTTDGEGRYEFAGIDNGKFFVLASHATHYSPDIEAAFAGGYEAGKREPPAQLAVRLPKEDQRVERNLVLASGAQLSGKVVDPEGRPVAGARVYVKNHGLRDAGRFWGMMMSSDGPFVTESNTDGTFEIEGLARRADWILFARKRGFSATESDPVDVTRASAENVNLRLAPQCLLRGHVLDADGQPLAEQSIFIGGYTTLRGGDWQFKSKQDGSFELDSLPAAMLNVSTSRGSESVELKINDLKPGDVREGLELRYGSKVEITGTVRNSQGEPGSGLTILVTRLDGADGWRMASTDSEGRFRIKNVAPGRVYLSLYVRGRSQEKLTETFEAPAADVAVTYDPPKTVVLEGVVLGPDGKSVELFSVGARSKDNKSTRVLESSGGTFKLEVEGKPPYWLFVRKPRHADGTPLNVRGGGVSVSDVDAKITLRLEAGVGVSGRVLDAEDKGVANVLISTPDGTKARSDVQGAWRLLGLGAEHIPLTVKPPVGFVIPLPILVAAGEANVEIHLQRGTQVRGRVLVPEGAKILGGQVKATWTSQGRLVGGSARGTIKPAGTFVVQGIAPGVRVTLEVSPYQDQAQSPRLASTTVDGVAAGRTDVEISLSVGVAVSGTVVNADGSPFSAGTVSLRGNGTGWSKIDESGAFRAEGLRPGTFDLHVFNGQGARRASQGVTAPATGVRVVLPETGTLSGKLIDIPSGIQWTVRALDPATGEPASGRGQADVKSDGSWTIGPVDRGRSWVVIARDKGGVSKQYARSEPVAVGAREVRLTLHTGGSIEGRTQRNGQALPRCGVRARGPGWETYTSSDGKGAFVLRGLPPGRYTVKAFSWTMRVEGEIEGVATSATNVVVNLDRDQK